MNRFTLAAVTIVGVPVVLVGYVALAEAALRRLPERRQAALRPWLWIAPALVLVSLFLVYPALRTIQLSFLDANSDSFVGLDNYRFLFGDAEMRRVLRTNVLWLVLFTGLTVLLGLVFAVLTDRVRYEPAAKAVIFLPMAISFVAAGVIWKFMYDYRPPGAPQTGAVNALLGAIIPGYTPHAWLIEQPGNNLALIIAAVWVWTGFCMVVLSAGLKGIPTDMLEAARVDGASEWQIVRRIVLPMLAPTLAVVTTTMIITALKVFDVVYIMTNGNFGTNVIANAMYKEMFNVRDFGRASAMAVLLLTAIVPVMLINLRRFRRAEAMR